MIRGVSIPTYNKPKAKEEKKMDTYPASILQAGQDYDEIMDRYRKILNQPQDPGIGKLIAQYEGDLRNPDKPYQRAPDVAASMANLNELSDTGGYSEQGIADLRARGVSPIRAVYQNAQQNITRQKALQGGYSPNYTAATAKLSRDLSESIAGQVSNINAGIAQNVASNRLSAAPSYAANAMHETSIMNQQKNINNQNRLTSLGALQSLYGNQQNSKLAATQGMTQLYGTTPATPALYGNQALQQGQLQQQERQLKQQGGVSLMNAYNQRKPPVSGSFRLG